MYKKIRYKNLMNAYDASLYANVAYGTIRKYMRQGKLPYFILPQKRKRFYFYIPAKRFQRFIEKYKRMHRYQEKKVEEYKYKTDKLTKQDLTILDSKNRLIFEIRTDLGLMGTQEVYNKYKEKINCLFENSKDVLNYYGLGG